MSWSLLAAAALSARPLLPSELEHLHTHRYAVIPHWVNAEQTDRLQKDAVAVDAHHGRTCTIGTADSETVRLNPAIRRSRQSSLYPPPPNSAGCVQTRAELVQAVGMLRSELQASTLLGLPMLEPFETELHYLFYPRGGQYKRHLDMPYIEHGWQRKGRRAADGGSFHGVHTRRVVSFILYLNRGWDDVDGGALRIFPANEHDYGLSQEALSAHAQDVLPEGGTLVVLMSADVEHLVRTTHAERQCVVGWFRERRTQHVPDLSRVSLRTLRALDRSTTLSSIAGLSDQLCLE